MSITTIVTAGFGNGTFVGSIAEVVTRGYMAGVGGGLLPKVITAGFGNGTFTGSIAEVVTRGFIVPPVQPSLFTIDTDLGSVTLYFNGTSYFEI